MKLSGLAFAYPDGTPGLRGVDLAVEAGEVTALVGDNRAGKSTLLHAVAGDLALAAGHVDAGGPVGWLVPAVVLTQAPWPGDFGRLYTVEDWCARPGAVVLADEPEFATSDHELRDRYHGALVEARARWVVVVWGLRLAPALTP